MRGDGILTTYEAADRIGHQYADHTQSAELALADQTLGRRGVGWCGPRTAYEELTTVLFTQLMRN